MPRRLIKSPWTKSPDPTGAPRLNAAILDSGKSLTERLLPSAHKQAIQHYMRQLGVKERGPANFTIVAEALSRGIHVAATDQGSIMLTYGDESFTWRSGGTSLNSKAVRQIAARKDVQSIVYRSHGLPFPKNCSFTADQEQRAWDWGKHCAALVVKPASGSKGFGVHVNIQGRQEFSEAFTSVSKLSKNILVEEFSQGSEHRLYVVEEHFVAALRIIPANITGDGINSIAELVGLKNQSAYIPHRKIRLEDTEISMLEKQQLTPETILNEGQRVFLRGNSNLSTGGDSVDTTDSVTDQEIKLVESAAQAFPDIKCIGFDVLLPRNPGDGKATIIEANMGAGTGGHHYPRVGAAREVAVPVLNAMFPETFRTYLTPRGIYLET